MKHLEEGVKEQYKPPLPVSNLIKALLSYSVTLES